MKNSFSLKSKSTPTLLKSRRSKHLGTHFARLRCQSLEDRVTPATLVGFSGNNLLTFSSTTPGTTTSTAVTGLASGETILDADVSTTTGQLIALVSSSRLYSINTTTGAATAIGTAGQFTLSGNEFAIDFNPVSGGLRVVSDTDVNLRLNAATGALTATDGILAFAMGDTNFGVNPNVTAIAYTNSVAGATSTTLYGIDTNLDALVIQEPNTGKLTTVGGIGVNATDVASFDIAPGSTTGLAALTVDGTTSALYSINLATGAATLVGNIGSTATLVSGLAIQSQTTSSFTSIVNGNAVTLNGSAGADSITIDVNDSGHLRHNLFTQGVAGFNSDIDFDSTLAGDQTVDVSSATSVTINGLAGDDSITIGSKTTSAADLGFNVTVNGGADSDTLNLIASEESKNSGTTVFHISEDKVHVASGSTILFSSIESLDITGGPGKDKFHVLPSADMAVTIHGGAPIGKHPGDSLHVNRGGTTGAKLTATPSEEGFSGTWTFDGLETVTFDGIEKVTPTSRIVVGAGGGGGPHVRFFDSEDFTEVFGFFAFDKSFRGGVNVASGDVNADGVADIVVAAAGRGGPHVKVFDGDTGELIREFFAYDASFTGGVNVAVGDINNDGFADIVTAPVGNGGSHIKVFSGEDGSLLREFFAYDAAFSGGVSVATGDVNGDGFADIITGAGIGGGPHIKVFSGVDNTVINEFFAFDDNFTGGTNVAAGDFDGDGNVDIVVGAASRGGPHVKVFNGTNQSILRNFFAFNANFNGGVRVAVSDVNGDGVPDLVVGQGNSNQSSRLRVFNGVDLTQLGEDEFAFGDFQGGIFVGGI